MKTRATYFDHVLAVAAQLVTGRIDKDEQERACRSLAQTLFFLRELTPGFPHLIAPAIHLADFLGAAFGFGKETVTDAALHLVAHTPRASKERQTAVDLILNGAAHQSHRDIERAHAYAAIAVIEAGTRDQWTLAKALETDFADRARENARAGGPLPQMDIPLWSTRLKLRPTEEETIKAVRSLHAARKQRMPEIPDQEEVGGFIMRLSGPYKAGLSVLNGGETCHRTHACATPHAHTRARQARM